MLEGGETQQLSANGYYRARQFAELAGVTVRALHHYDRLGLLKAQRSTGGYRLYQESDLHRLEQIVALKFIGIPLRRITGLLKADAVKLSQALRAQRRVLEEKKRLLETTIDAIHKAEDASNEVGWLKPPY